MKFDVYKVGDEVYGIVIGKPVPEIIRGIHISNFEHRCSYDVVVRYGFIKYDNAYNCLAAWLLGYHESRRERKSFEFYRDVVKNAIHIGDIDISDYRHVYGYQLSYKYASIIFSIRHD